MASLLAVVRLDVSRTRRSLGLLLHNMISRSQIDATEISTTVSSYLSTPYMVSFPDAQPYVPVLLLLHSSTTNRVLPTTEEEVA